MEVLPSPSTRTRLERYPGYPVEHFSLDLPLERPLQDIVIPEGPWSLNARPLPTPEASRLFNEQGYKTDSLGRPLHPWARQLLSAETGGVTTGKGAYWNWGPNLTVDPIVITNEARPRILLIERSDTGALALPGGFADGDELPRDGALRELKEETGLELTQAGKLIYQGPVADLRTTLHAWAETSAFLFYVDEACEVTGNDDALSADWYYIDELPTTLFGSHAVLVKMALKY